LKTFPGIPCVFVQAICIAVNICAFNLSGSLCEKSTGNGGFCFVESVFWWTHSSIWGTTPSCHFRSNFYIDELTKIYHGIVSCKCYSNHIVKVRGREKGKKKQGPTQKLFLGLNMFVLCPFSGQHFTGKINDNW